MTPYEADVMGAFAMVGVMLGVAFVLLLVGIGLLLQTWFERE